MKLTLAITITAVLLALSNPQPYEATIEQFPNVPDLKNPVAPVGVNLPLGGEYSRPNEARVNEALTTIESAGLADEGMDAKLAHKVEVVSKNYPHIGALIEAFTRAHFGEEHIYPMKKLLAGESGWYTLAGNPSSGACGLFQAYPCSKLPCELEDANCQMEWGVSYIKSRYGNPTNAYKFWLSQEPHWY